MLRNEKGVILIAAYLIIVVLLILGGAFMVRSVTEKRVADREHDSMQAFYLAEAGLETAHRGLVQNWAGYTTELPRTAAFTQSFTDVGNFSVDIVAGPLANSIKLTSAGTVGANSRSVEEIVRGTVGSGLSGYDFALLAAGNLFLEGEGSIENQDVYVNGNLTLASPDAISGGNTYAKGNATLLTGGSVTGNVNANGNITVNTGATIDGDATAKGNVGNSGTITGTSTPHATPDPVDEDALSAKVESYRLSSADWDEYEAAAQAAGTHHSGNFSPSGTYSGTHYVTGNVVIENDFSGTATFVIEGNVNFSEGSVSLDPAPGSDYSFIVGGNIQSTSDAVGALGGVIYCGGNFAVSTSITLSGAIICFGNLHGSGDFNIEFPVAETTLEILSWRELF